MARINTNRAALGIALATTWGTAIDFSSGGAGKKTHCAQFSVSASRGRFNPRDNGFNNFIKEVVALEESVTLNMSFDLASGNWWPILAANFMGTSSTPTETTGGQGDYAQALTFTNEIDGEFVTIAHLVEDDFSVEYPSVKVTGMSINIPANNVGTISFTAIADRVVIASPTNTAAKINALAYPTVYESLVLGGTNHYCRINAASGAGLSSSDDKKILNFNCSFARPMQPDFALRGANSFWTDEPQQLGVTTGTCSIQLKEIDDAVLNMISEWKNLTEDKLELFIDGSQIGSGVNRSIKMQFPDLAPAPGYPGGYDIPNANSLMQPTMTWQVLQAEAAPTGMTGVTDYMKMSIIDNNNFQYN